MLSSHPSTAVQRAVGATVLGTLTLATGVAFAILGGDSSLEKRTEIVKCTATGGIVGYSYCDWQEPSDNAGSGATIQEIQYKVGNSPLAVGVDGTIGNSATESGSTAITPFTDITTGTGANFEYVAGGASGSLVINEGNYIRFITLTDPTASHTATILITYTSSLAHD